MALDATGDLYFADSGNNLVRKIDTNGVITTVAGSCTVSPCVAGSGGDGWPATSAQLNAPGGVALDGLGNLYIADTANNEVRVVNLSTGIINTYAGTGVAGTAGTGTINGNQGAATATKLNKPPVVAWYGGNLYIADAGTGTQGFSGNGAAAGAAQLYNHAVIIGKVLPDRQNCAYNEFKFRRSYCSPRTWFTKIL